jgi:hypothetical protein
MKINEMGMSDFDRNQLDEDKKIIQNYEQKLS